MRGYEVQERAERDVEALGNAHAIAFGALSYIATDAADFERCRRAARKALVDLEHTWDERA